MDEYLKKLVTELGEAINRAVDDSTEVSDCLARIRATGNDVFLALEATVAFHDKPSEEADEPASAIPPEKRFAEISHEDKQFLRSLNIRFDNDES